MCGAGDSRSIQAHKARIFLRIQPMSLLSVMDTGNSYGKRLFVVVARHSGSLEVIELTISNLVRMTRNQILDRSRIKFDEFMADTFHVIDCPGLVVA